MINMSILRFQRINMVALTDYWYYGQVERIMLHTARLFCNFQISIGKDENGEDILKRVPLNTAFNDKTVAGIMTGSSDTYLQTAPRMILQLTGLTMNTEKAIGPAYQKVFSTITERKWDPEKGNYVDGRENGIGTSYEITRMNPIPIGLTFKLHILTTMYSQKFQLFEQIRCLFTPQNEIQMSENPLDWDRTAPIIMTDIDFSSKLNNVSSNELDDMVLTFKVDTNLDLPCEIMRTRNDIQQINVNGVGEEFGWNFEVGTLVYTPTECTINVMDNNKIYIYEPFATDPKTLTWKDIFDTYKLSNTAGNINMALLNNKDIKTRSDEISGNVRINPQNPRLLDYRIDYNTLPASTVDDIDDIIDPMVSFPSVGLPPAREGQRYLIVSNIGENTTAWGIIKDKNGFSAHAKENQIIEYKNGFWTVAFDPEEVSGKKLVRCMADDLLRFLYIYVDDKKMWTDYINHYYKAGYFRFWVG